MYEENATGITMRSMFENFNSEEIRELCFFRYRLVGEEKQKFKSILLPLKNRPLEYLLRKEIGKRCISKLNKDIKEAEKREENLRLKNKKRLKLFMRGLVDISLIYYNKKLLKEIDEFHPTVIYTMGASVGVLKTALFFKKRYSVKSVLHYMDNWRETMYKESIFFKIYRISLERTLKKILEKKSIEISISEKMSIEYKKKYNSISIPIMNSIDLRQKDSIFFKKNMDLVVFTYAGGLHLSRWRELLKVQTAIEKIKNQTDLKIEFRIYTSARDRIEYENYFNSEITEFKDFLSHDKVNLIYEESDILVHVESFEKEMIEFTKYSLSTKISEYMSSGRPILCYAPQELAVYQYIEKYNFGLCNCDETGLLSSIEKFSKDRKFRIKLGKNGKKYSKLFHSKEKTYKILNKIFMETY